MATDIDLIRRKLAELKGENRGGEINYFFPEAGETKVRCLPWKNAPAESPIIELSFYKIGNNKRTLAPYQFGLPDPIHDFRMKLYKTKKEDDKKVANSLRPKMSGYLPVVLRGKEDDGVKVWMFSPFVYKRLLGFWLNEDYGDVTSPIEGYDLTIKMSPAANGKMFNGKPVLDTEIDPRPKSTPLHADSAVSEKLLNAVPCFLTYIKKQLKSAQELEGMLNTWLNGDDEEKSDGTEKGSSTSSADLDKLVDEVAEAKPAKKEEKPAAKPAGDAKQKLDAAFDELMEDGDNE